MAVNDSALKRKIEEASDYFSKLQWRGGEVDNGEMIALAAYAASVFSEPIDRERICKKLGWNKYTAIADGTSVNDVMCMAELYAEGERKIDAYVAENSKRLCGALLEYIEIREKEIKDAKDEEERRKHTESMAEIKQANTK